MDWNTIYYVKFQTWNLALNTTYNKCKLAIQVIYCSNNIPYKTFSSQSKN